MACHLLRVKPLSEPVMIYCQVNPKGRQFSDDHVWVLYVQHQVFAWFTFLAVITHTPYNVSARTYFISVFSITIPIWWKIRFIFYSIPGNAIATTFCTCYDSTAVVSCAKLCGNQFFRILNTAIWSSPHISIVMEKFFIEMSTWLVLIATHQWLLSSPNHYKTNIDLSRKMPFNFM